jgi:hypothetical protein
MSDKPELFVQLYDGCPKSNVSLFFFGNEVNERFSVTHLNFPAFTKLSIPLTDDTTAARLQNEVCVVGYKQRPVIEFLAVEK